MGAATTFHCLWLAVVVLVISKSKCLKDSDQLETVQQLKDGFDKSLHNLVMEIDKLDFEYIAKETSIHLLGKAVELTFKNISNQCLNDMKWVVRKLVFPPNNEDILNYWPFEMLDSVGKPSAGILKGNVQWLGRYKKCVDIVATNVTQPSKPFTGKYCLINLSLPHHQMMLHIRLGVCLPSTCSETDVGKIVQRGISYFHPVNNVTVSSDNCQHQEKDQLDTTAAVLISVLVIYGVIIFGASALDFVQSELHLFTERFKGFLLQRYISTFSAIANMKRIFYENHDELNDFGAIHGILVISQFMIVAGHFFFSGFLDDVPWINRVDLYSSISDFSLQPFFNGYTYFFDTLFTISGLLVTYNYLNRCATANGWKQWISYYCSPLLKLLPAYVLVIMVMAGPLFYANYGPVWTHMKQEMNSCRTLWWTNVFYINNLFSCHFECLRTTWYLAVDMQLYILAPLFLYPLYRKPQFGLLLLASCSLIGIALSIILIVQNNYTTMLVKAENINDIEKFIYELFTKFWYHMTPYYIGMATGYALHIHEKPKVTRKCAVVGWTLALVVIIYAMVGSYLFTNQYISWNTVASVIHGAFSRPLWALSTCWIIFACSIGYGGFLNRLLSMEVLKPVSQMTYCSYLLFYMVGTFYIYGQEDNLYYTKLNMVTIITSNYVITFGFAVALAVVIELPMTEIFKDLAGTWIVSNKCHFKPALHYVTLSPNKTLKGTETDEEHDDNAEKIVY